MDATTVPEQDAAAMRQDIDTTRSAMADKLEALEDKVMNTVQNAQDTVKDSLQSAKDTVASVKQTFDLKHQVEQRPWTMVGGCFLAGLAVGHLLPRRRPQSSMPPSGPAAIWQPCRRAACPSELPRLQAEPPRQSSVLEPFQEEISKVKAIAIDFVVGLIRDSIKESVPQMASKIDDLMNGITTKLRGSAHLAAETMPLPNPHDPNPRRIANHDLAIEPWPHVRHHCVSTILSSCWGGSCWPRRPFIGRRKSSSHWRWRFCWPSS